MSWVRISSPAPISLKHIKVLHRKLDTYFLCDFLLVPQPVPLLSHDSRYWYHFMHGCIDLVVYRKRHMQECIRNRFYWYHFMRFCNRWYHFMRYCIANLLINSFCRRPYFMQISMMAVGSRWEHFVNHQRCWMLWSHGTPILPCAIAGATGSSVHRS